MNSLEATAVTRKPQPTADTLTPMEPARPFPRRVFLPDWVWAVAFVGTVAGTLVTDSAWCFGVPAFLAFAQGIYVYHLVRCPTCSGRLQVQLAPIPYTTCSRFQLACPRCQIVWDTGKISDDHAG